MLNFDPTKWSVITPLTTGSTCDISSMRAAIFTVDLDYFEGLCSLATGCTFDKTLYEPYAFGFLWAKGVGSCTGGPLIIPPPNSPLPFEGLLFMHVPDPPRTLVYNDVYYQN